VIDTSALVRAVEALLDVRQVRDIDYLGWLNQNDPNPEYVGYAMWTIDPPWDLIDRLNGPAPSDEQRRLTELGEEFIGLMKMSRF